MDQHASNINTALKILNLQFRIKDKKEEIYFSPVEVELYPESDPYTHGHPEQIKAGPLKWYFHRASSKPDSKYKGGTFKGVDVTYVEDGKAGGALIRSIWIHRKNEGTYELVEGSCNVVHKILELTCCEDIPEFVERNGVDVEEGNILPYFPKTETLDQNALVMGPRVGLGYSTEPERYQSLFSTLRFYPEVLYPLIKKYKAFTCVCRDNTRDLPNNEKWEKHFSEDYTSSEKPRTIPQLLSAYGTWYRKFS